MTNWSKETIQKTLDVWGPEYAKKGEILTEDDAREMLDNVTGLFDLLYELDQKYMEKDQK
jgi:hypothetical protein